MTKYKQSASAEKKKEIVCPSDHGSHKSMLSTNEQHVKFNNAELDNVICEDNKGCYITERSALDNGRADYKRACTIKERDDIFESFIASPEYKEAVADLVPMNAPE